MRKLSQSVLFSLRAVLCCAMVYRPGTYNEEQPPKEPRVHIDRADRTVEALGEPTGIVVITD